MHHANGNPCDCRLTPYAKDMTPEKYAELHPNKKGPNGETFNDAVDESRRSGDRYVSFYH